MMCTHTLHARYSLRKLTTIHLPAGPRHSFMKPGLGRCGHLHACRSKGAGPPTHSLAAHGLHTIWWRHKHSQRQT